MPGSTETICIESCPICGGRHAYDLRVERSTVVRAMVESSWMEEPRRISVTRLFTCPAKDSTFQATVILYETPSTRVESVEVEGPAEEEGEGNE